MSQVRATDGSVISYRVLGTGDLAVMLVHGWMVSGAVFDTMVEQWTHTGLRLVIPDLRGTGKSDKPATGYTLDAHVRDLLAIADQEGLRSLVLVGHSMGGQLAQLIAARHPERVRGLVLVNPVPASGIAMPDQIKTMFRGSGGSAEAQGAILDMATVALPAAERERLVRDAGLIPAACIAEIYDAFTGAAFAGELARIAAPTLVVATDDAFLPPAFLSEQVVRPIRKARLAVLPGCGHYPQCERPRELAAVLDAFLSGLGTSESSEV